MSNHKPAPWLRILKIPFLPVIWVFRYQAFLILASVVVVPLAIYNAGIVSAGEPDIFSQILFEIPNTMIQITGFFLLFVILFVMLLVEILQARNIQDGSTINDLLSGIHLGALLMFLVLSPIEWRQTAIFLIFVVQAMEFVLSLSIRLAIARRDFGGSLS